MNVSSSGTIPPAPDVQITTVIRSPLFTGRLSIWVQPGGVHSYHRKKVGLPPGLVAAPAAGSGNPQGSGLVCEDLRRDDGDP